VFKSFRFVCAAVAMASLAVSALAQGAKPAVSVGYWTPLTHQPTFKGALVPILLTDGSILVQEGNNFSTDKTILGETYHWWKLTPDAFGSYVNGTWTQVADMRSDYTPLYYASAVLADGRVIVIGGEYNNNAFSWTKLGAIYDPVTNSWNNVDAPPGWDYVGDAQCVVLPDGKFMLANSHVGDLENNGTTAQAAILDPVPMTWSNVSLTGKENNFDEEGWTLMPDGTLLTVDAEDTPNAEKYIPWDDDWVQAGQTPLALTGGYGYEMGPAVLRFDGTVMAFGANPHTAIYMPPATPTDPGSWNASPDVPTGGLADGPACQLPNGRVLLASSPNLFGKPVTMYETDGTTFMPIPSTAHCSDLSSYQCIFLVLPNGQVMFNDTSNDVEIYTPSGGPSDSWRPTITSFFSEITAGDDYPISGTQFNGLSQTNFYGDDWSNATNYPLVRITNNATGHVFYCRTHDHSTMAVATGAQTVTTHFTVPNTIENGSSKIEIVANGIASAPQDIVVGPPTITSIDPTSGNTGQSFEMTINGNGFASGAAVDWFDPSNNETQLTPDTVNGTQITVTVPASVLTMAGTCVVKVENSALYKSNGENFTLIQANHPPVANAGADQTKEATGPATSFTLDGTGSTDADSDPLTYTWYDSSNTQVGTGSTLTLLRAVGVYTFKLTVSDGKASNDDTVQITIQDTTPPAFGVLPDIVVAPTSNAGAVVTFGPFTANDLVDGAITGTAVPASGSTFPAGSTTVNVSATDAHSNTGHASFHVNVLYSWSGFLSPFPKQQFKMGSNIPIKFALTGASAGITNLVATGYWATVNGAIVGPDHTIGTFSYNAATATYQLNWKTNVPKGTYQIKAVFGDGSVHTIQVILK
jgi:hypothetical protein